MKINQSQYQLFNLLDYLKVEQSWKSFDVTAIEVEINARCKLRY